LNELPAMKTTPPPARIVPHDDGLEWLRAIRREITTSFDHDQTRLGDFLREREKQLGDRIFRTQRRVVPLGSAASAGSAARPTAPRE
jgi:hypothetical protein